MTLRPVLFFLFLLAVVAVPFSACSRDSDKVAVLETTYGRIVFEFEPDLAPNHVKAFEDMFSSGFFDGTTFHRVIPGRVIQGGNPNSKDDDPNNDLEEPDNVTQIPAEFSNTAHFERGTVGAARKGNDKDSASSQFFITTHKETGFDGQYTIFGRVIDGMSIVDLIANAPLRTDDPKLRERPINPVKVTRAYLSTRSALGLPPKQSATNENVAKPAGAAPAPGAKR